jgi:eukaryotic-like serine/threonine-protein kinase
MDAVAHLNASLAGRYLIEREIGRGGMATVYLARDVRHDRKVAVKVLNPELGAVLGVDRFLAEIRVTANLQHPNLLALFDSGETHTGPGHEGAFLYYVMPYVEGESLRARLDREKQLPIDEAVRITVAVASALDYAHRHGVIHRDLKPENVLLHDGQPLVADFGIALAVSNAGAGRITQTGLSLGTPQYMSPEQATGDRVIDGRTDVYSLGAVLYEMLTGEPPHTGATAQAIIARVITDKPRSVRATRDTVPEHIDLAIERALAKLPADRWPTAQAFAESLLGRGVTLPAGAITPGSMYAKPAVARWRPRTTVAVMTVGALGFAGAGWFAARRTAPAPAVTRYAIEIPDSLAVVDQAGVLESPDRSRLAFVAEVRSSPDTVLRLWLKRRDRHDAEPLQGPTDVRGFTFSPDGRWVAFIRGVTGPNQLWKIPVDGGVPAKLADSVASGWSTPTWLDDNTIVFASVLRELRQVSDTGGVARVVWRNDTTGAALPIGLPGSRGVAFIQCMAGICARPTLTVLDLESAATRTMGDGVLRVQYSPTGHLVVLRDDGTMHAVPFDVRALRATGQPFPVMNDVFGGTTEAWFSLSASGTLSLWRGARFTDTENHQLWWYDRAGRASPMDSSWTFALGAAGLNQAMWSLSPDGRRLAIGLAGDGVTSVWLKTMPDGPVSRLTFQTGERATAFRPKFTPDGRSVSYFLTRRNGWDLYRTLANGSGTPELLFTRREGYEHADWSRDGKWLVLQGRGVNDSRDVFAAQITVDTAPRPIVATAFQEQNPALSPDGRWLAYQSNESGRYEVYVRPFPGVDGGKWLVSRAAGTRSPVWSKDGRELFYIDDVRRELVAVPITTSPELTAGVPRALFRLPDDAYLIHFITDGQRFLVARRSAALAPRHRPLIVTENWTQELRQLVPATRP